MNVDRIITMVMRQITRRLVNGGINKGIDIASSLGKSDQDPSGKKQSPQSAKDAKRIKDLARMARRSTKF